VFDILSQGLKLLFKVAQGRRFCKQNEHQVEGCAVAKRKLQGPGNSRVKTREFTRENGQGIHA
jgi:hypothetical protein